MSFILRATVSLFVFYGAETVSVLTGSKYLVQSNVYFTNASKHCGSHSVALQVKQLMRDGRNLHTCDTRTTA